jgi:hypothetical protein
MSILDFLLKAKAQHDLTTSSYVIIQYTLVNSPKWLVAIYLVAFLGQHKKQLKLTYNILYIQRV